MTKAKEEKEKQTKKWHFQPIVRSIYSSILSEKAKETYDVF